jgi:hypothetical protein
MEKHEPIPLEIDVWYGSRQRFGHLGNPQRWINILGTVSCPERLESLSYQLNGGEPRSLAVGPDGLRLRAPGDFDAEIPVTALREGENEVLLSAQTDGGQQATCTVIVDYAMGRIWPLPYAVDWKSVDAISEAVQIVDGRWHRAPTPAVGGPTPAVGGPTPAVGGPTPAVGGPTPAVGGPTPAVGGIRPEHAAYDRLVTLGDATWQDYRLQVVARVHGFADQPQPHQGLAGGFGLLFRWTGHRADGHQPSREWRPNGAIGWYRARWEDRPARYRCLNISDAVVKDEALAETGPLTLDLDRPYVYEFSVRSQPGATGHYTYRVWPEDDPHRLLCDLAVSGREGEAPRGSILLIALYCDVTIGNLRVDPL